MEPADRRPALFVVVALGLTPGCAATGVSSMSRLVSLSEREEARVGSEARLELEHDRIFVEGGPALERERQVGAELVAVAPDVPVACTFDLLDTPQENAFALPGGSVIITRGLFLLLNDLDELAGVLGHEIGHIAEHHAASRLGLARPLGTLTALLRRAVGSVDEAVGDEVSARLPALLLAPYARAQEREADRFGITLAGSAGFEAQALARVLVRLQGGADEPDPTSRVSTLFASHPSPAARAELIRALAQSLERPTRAVGAPLDEAQDGLTVGDGPGFGLQDGERVLLPAWGLSADLPGALTFVPMERGFATLLAGGLVQLRVRVVDAMSAAATREKLRSEPAVVDWWEAAVDVGLRIDATLALGTPVWLNRWSWLALDGVDLEVVADGRAADVATWGPVVDRFLASVRRAGLDELATVEILRLRFVEAAAGESLASLAVRAGSAWPSTTLARVNDLDLAAPLAAGRRVKVAKAERLSCTAESSGVVRCH